jgi:tetratricopeptide (TPR) repeat protein
MTSLATLTKDASLEICFPCHAVKTSLSPGYLPGKPLADHYALKLPLLLDSIYFADGRTRVFAYQESHLASDCYLNGSMTCVDCHDPHSQDYRDVNGAPIPGRFDDRQCLGCHPSKAESIERHTRHPASSAGSRCVSCHMPYLQQPNVGKRVRYARSDHAIPIPRPLYDSGLGIESACLQCHRDRTPEVLEANVTAWWGTLKPHPEAITAAMAARQTRDAAAAARTVLATDQDRHPWAEFVGLADVFQRLVQSNMVGLESETRTELERRARSTDIDNRALALASLHLARGDDPSVRRFLARELRSLGPQDHALRARWAWILRVRGDEYLGKQDYESAQIAFERALELLPDDVDGLRGLGTVYTRRHNFPMAVQQFERVLALRPRDGQALVGLGFALLQADDFRGATASFRRAIEANPWDPSGHANLGLAQLRTGALSEAVGSFLQAIRLEPGLAATHFALAEAYGRQGRLEEAAAALEQGLRIEPGNAGARRMLQAVRGRQ